MSTWFRCAQTKQENHVFSGEGGLYVAGRWHYRGTKAIYCSQSISLCTLEWLAHNGLSVSGFSYHKFSIEIPSDLIIHFNISDFPPSWADTPAPNSNRDFAVKNFYQSSDYLAMAVPSVMVPEELNLIINPLHQAFMHAKASIRYLGRFSAPNR